MYIYLSRRKRVALKPLVKYATEELNTLDTVLAEQGLRALEVKLLMLY